MNALVMILLFSMMPRFIISIRELYDRDLRRRWQGIDTGFGVLSQPTAGENPTMSAIGFADVTLGEPEGEIVEGNTGDSEMTPSEVVEGGAHIGSEEGLCARG